MATLLQLFNRIQWQSDQQAGSRLAEADVIPFVNLAMREAWEIIVASGEDYFAKLHTPGTFTLAGGPGGSTFQITAADFFKVKGVQMQIGGRWSDPLPTFEFNEWGSPPDGISYRHEFDTLYFEPFEVVGGTYRLWYIYKPTDLANDNDILTDVNGWIEQYVIDAVSLRTKVREAEDVSVLQDLRAALQKRIVGSAAQRNRGKGRKVARTRTGRRWRFFTRSGIPLP